MELSYTWRSVDDGSNPNGTVQLLSGGLLAVSGQDTLGQSFLDAFPIPPAPGSFIKTSSTQRPGVAVDFIVVSSDVFIIHHPPGQEVLIAPRYCFFVAMRAGPIPYSHGEPIKVNV